MNKTASLVMVFLSVTLLAGCRGKPIDLQIIRWEVSQQEKEHQEGSGVTINYKLVNRSKFIVIEIAHELVVNIRHSQPYPRSRQQTYQVVCGREEIPLLDSREEREYEKFIRIPLGDEVLGVSGRVLGAELITDTH
jgi:hypothetical protein